MIKEEEELQKFIYERFNMKTIETETEVTPYPWSDMWKFVLDGRLTHDEACEIKHKFSWISRMHRIEEELYLDVEIQTRNKK